VDRALRAAKEPVQLAEEQIRFHGTDTWKVESLPWLGRVDSFDPDECGRNT